MVAIKTATQRRRSETVSATIAETFSHAENAARACFHMVFPHPFNDCAARPLFCLFQHRFFQQPTLDTVPSRHAVRRHWPQHLVHPPREDRSYHQAERHGDTWYGIAAAEKLNTLLAHTSITLLFPVCDPDERHGNR